jgi:hypothetical protein
VGFLNSTALAAIVASGVIYALSTHKGHLVYLVPVSISGLFPIRKGDANEIWNSPTQLAIQLSTPFLAILTIVFLPEKSVLLHNFRCPTPAEFFHLTPSPQWLVQQGRTEEALAVLRILRPAQGSDDLVRTELAEMIAATSEMGAKRGTIGDCFRGVQLRRTLACMGIACLFQAQGESGRVTQSCRF